jgi:serine/threonine protein kinase
VLLLCRSVGCTVIELLEGRPPYHALKPMQALYRIVQDDSPPIPEGASPIVKDFLYHCFQKDCNLRISAKKLLRHPWMLSAKKQMSEGKRSNGQVEGSRPLSNYNFDEALLKVQEWNEALRCEPAKLSGVRADQIRFIQLRRGLRNMVGVTIWTSLGRNYPPRLSNHALASHLRLLPLLRL